MKEPTKIPPLPAEGQGVKFPNLERNFSVIFWVVIVASALLGLAYSVFVYETRALKNQSEQHQSERQAIERGHAIETNPQEDFARDARKLRDKLRAELESTDI